MTATVLPLGNRVLSKASAPAFLTMQNGDHLLITSLDDYYLQGKSKQQSLTLS